MARARLRGIKQPHPLGSLPSRSGISLLTAESGITTSTGVKISALPVASSVNGIDQLETNQAGTSRRITLDQVASLVGTELTDDYLPLAGGTLTGALVGTTAAFSGAVTASNIVVVQNHLTGCTLSNSGALGIAVSTGQWADTTNASMVTQTAVTKLLSATWATGSGNGGRGTGVSLTSNTWYHVFAIVNGGVANAYFDTSVTGANAPGGTTWKRRLGSVLTDGTAANIVTFLQTGDFFHWKALQTAFSVINPGTSVVNRTLIVPTGLKIMARSCFSVFNMSTTNDTTFTYGDPDTPGMMIYPMAGGRNAAGVSNNTRAQLDCMTNASAQVATQVDFSDGNVTITGHIVGWTDTRGRDG